MEEIWRNVDRFEDAYAVSNLGRVKSKGRIVMRRNGVHCSVAEKILKQSEYHGYWRIFLRSPGIRETVFSHRLVAAAFIGKHPDGMDVCHGDGDRKNNCVTNLRYGTRSDNVRDSILHKTHRSHGLKGEEMQHAKLTEEKVREIKASNDSSCALARKFGVSRAAIRNIRSGRSWKHVV